MDEVVALNVRGMVYEGWKEIRISRSIKAIAASFSLSLTDNWSDLNKPWILVPGDECEVRSNGQTILRGYIDDVETSYDSRTRTISVSGREVTGDLVDSSVRYDSNTEFESISLVSLAQKLCKPHGIAVRNDSGNAKAMVKVAVNVGDTVHQVLEKAARQVGLLLNSDGHGTLLIQKIGQTTAGAKLIEGTNLLSASARFSMKNRFKEYRVVSQNNFEGLDEVSQVSCTGSSTDAEVTRDRFLVVHAEQASTPELCRVRAKWEQVHRRGESVRVNTKVQGWRLADGSLFEPNRLYRVDSAWIGIDADLLLEEINLTCSSQGTLAELTFTRKDAYLPDSTATGNEVDLLKKLVEQNQKVRK